MNPYVKKVPSDMCASEDSDQTAHSRSLIRIFTERILDSEGCKYNDYSDLTAWMRRLIRVFVGAHDIRYVFHDQLKLLPLFTRIIQHFLILTSIDEKVNRAVSSEKMLSSMPKCAFRSACACSKYHPGLWSPFIHSVVSSYSISGYRIS